MQDGYGVSFTVLEKSKTPLHTSTGGNNFAYNLTDGTEDLLRTTRCDSIFSSIVKKAGQLTCKLIEGRS